MNRFNIFIMRAVLAAFFAVVITRFFYGRVAPFYVAGLAVFLAGMSYVTEYFRHKKRGSSPKELIQMKDSRIPGVEDSSDTK